MCYSYYYYYKTKCYPLLSFIILITSCGRMGQGYKKNFNNKQNSRFADKAKRLLRAVFLNEIVKKAS